ncbi:MAG: uracil-DNA glycosylase family protein [Acidobacteria bacterium]|nr:uracil-DNA glycosylase family protein [Acidobacteriota bacterium]
MTQPTPLEQTNLDAIVEEARRCDLCVPNLPLGPNPLFKVSADVRILVIGQAPGRVAHLRSTPWDDKSGDRLRSWLGITRNEFYSRPEVGLLPMGFCFPGTGPRGDLAPRPECADAWHSRIIELLPNRAMTLLVGRYAFEAYWRTNRSERLTAAARDWRSRFPESLVLPHPSPRNNRWLAANPWFEAEAVPAIREEVARLLSST